MKKEGRKLGLNQRNLAVLAGVVAIIVLGVLVLNFGQKFGLDLSKGVAEFSAENLTAGEFRKGVVKELDASEDFEFIVNGESHLISIKEMSDESVTIVVQSEPIELTLSVGGETRVELTEDNYYDMYLRLDSISDGKASLVIKSIKEEIAIIPEEPEEQGDGSAASSGSTSSSGAGSSQDSGAQAESCTNTCSPGYNQKPYPDCGCYAIDTDGDGVKDPIDAFPTNPLEWADSDSDGVGDNSDVFPNDAAESKDTDGDGVGNNADTDDDNDGRSDNTDAFPLDSGEWLDSDSDGIGDNADIDDDGDSYNDAADAFPLNSSEWLDSDSDGTGDNADIDDDNDGTLDEVDINPLDASITGQIGGQSPSDDFDNDGTINMYDSDDDGDSVADSSDLAPFDASDTRHWVCITCASNWDVNAYGMGPWFNEYYIGSFNTLSKGYHVHEMKAEVKVSNQYPGTSIRYKWDLNGNLIWDGTINLADGWKNCGTAYNLDPSKDYRYQDGRYNLGQPTAGMLIRVSAIVD